MKIATILFTYNRSEHTKKVLDALKENSVLPEKLYVFQDGLKIETHKEEWEKVNGEWGMVDGEWGMVEVWAPPMGIEITSNRCLSNCLLTRKTALHL